jgi:hypothetical protein
MPPMGSSMGGAMSASPIGGAGMGGPPMGGMGGMGGAPSGASSPSAKLKAYNVWDVLERVLKDES